MKRLAALAAAALATAALSAPLAQAASAAPAPAVTADNNGCIIVLNWTVLCIPRL